MSKTPKTSSPARSSGLSIELEKFIEIAGGLAALAGTPKCACPYVLPPAREAWVRGWEDAVTDAMTNAPPNTLSSHRLH